MVFLLILTLMCIAPVFAARKKQNKVVVQANVPLQPGQLIPAIPGLPTKPAPAVPMATTQEHHELPPVPTPIVAPVVAPEPVVKPTEPKPAEHLDELKLALDRVSGLEQKIVVLESKLSSAEQKLSKVESQLTTFINELSAPSPEEEEDVLPTSAGMVAEEDEDGEDSHNRML